MWGHSRNFIKQSSMQFNHLAVNHGVMGMMSSWLYCCGKFIWDLPRLMYGSPKDYSDIASVGSFLCRNSLPRYCLCDLYSVHVWVDCVIDIRLPLIGPEWWPLTDKNYSNITSDSQKSMERCNISNNFLTPALSLGKQLQPVVGKANLILLYKSPYLETSWTAAIWVQTVVAIRLFITVRYLHRGCNCLLNMLKIYNSIIGLNIFYLYWNK